MSSIKINPDQLVKILKKTVETRKLERFYPASAETDELFRNIANESTSLLQNLAQEWDIGRKQKSLILNLIQLALYDIVFFLDDSGSMNYGTRISDLHQTLSYASKVCSILDQDGVTIAFINDPVVYHNVNSEEQIQQIVNGKEFKLGTRLAANLESKVIKPLILDNLTKRKLSVRKLFGGNKKTSNESSAIKIPKPFLVIVITDGRPTEPMSDLGKLINKTKNQLVKDGYSPFSAVFQISQVGDDEEAQQFLEYLDNHPVYGDLVDTVGTFVEESKEIKAKKGIELSYQMWIIKLLLGAVDSEFDKMDEVDSTIS